MEIKPCPFCGSSDKMVELVPSCPNWWSVRCWGCGAFGLFRDSPKEAVRWWNRRPGDGGLVDFCWRKLSGLLSG